MAPAFDEIGLRVVVTSSAPPWLRRAGGEPSSALASGGRKAGPTFGRGSSPRSSQLLEEEADELLVELDQPPDTLLVVLVEVLVFCPSASA